ncbi:hypothetical protein N4G70_12335 [Streptomyces sp. ASQP_92]|uniref:hypothetical protein n=1 Tax=Streptomyces sp. ASQP_92 TaxID=2979116 RepID=UPI0021C0B639|nr:hypothetical protein [Streptomyces sp. ASQP_92]MCT9089658.1 hypothetical protein [Streptomyces sp. ASQP_92]
MKPLRHLAHSDQVHPLRRFTTAVRAGSVAAAALASFALAASPAAASGVIVEIGPVASTYTAFAGCTAQVIAGTDREAREHFGRASFQLGTSSRGKPCLGWLERRYRGQDWGQVGDKHRWPDTTTAWYYAGSFDDPQSANVRACVGDFLYSNSFSCEGQY